MDTSIDGNSTPYRDDGADMPGIAAATTAPVPGPATKAQLDKLRIALHRNGYHPIPILSHDQPVMKAGKRPALKQWQKPVTDEAAISTWSDQSGWRTAASTGVLTGKIVGVDIDVPDATLAAEIRALVESMLGGPTPLVRFGAAPKVLLVYRADMPATVVMMKTMTPELFLPDGTKVQVEVLGHGQQFVSYGIHPDTKRPYRWEGGDPLKVPMSDLPPVTRDQLLNLRDAAESLLRAKGALTKQERASARTKKKGAGSRTSGGGLVAAAAADGDAFFRQVNRAALDRIDAWAPAIFPTGRFEGTGAFRVSSADLNRGLQEDISIHPDGGRDFGEETGQSPIDIVIRHGAEAGVIDQVDAVTGKPDTLTAALWLCERLGVDPVTFGYQPELSAVAEAVAELNEKHFVVTEGGATIVMTERYNSALNRTYYERSKFRDIEQYYSNEHVKIGEKDGGAAILMPKGKLWLYHHPRRRTYSRVVFDPSGAQHDGAFNLWRSFAVKPKPGNWSLMQLHMVEVICAGDIDLAIYLRHLMARMVQRPGETGEVVIVLRGGEGVGKGVFARMLMMLFGRHGLQVSNAAHLVGKHNEHLRDIVLLFADEAFFAGDRAHIGVLKALITEPTLFIEPKGFPGFPVPNYLHIIMSTNNAWAVPADLQSRRWFVLDVPPLHQGDRAYFNALWRQMEHEGGLAAMLHDLLQDDLTGFDHRDTPTTAGLNDQRKLSLSIPERWWWDCLSREYVFVSKYGHTDYFGKWHTKLATELLFNSYREFCREHRDRNQLSREDFGRFLVKMGGKAGRIPVAENVVGESQRGLEHHGDRPWGYRLGTLKEARDVFTKKTGLTVNWDD